MPYSEWEETRRNRILNPQMLSLTGWATTAAGWSITSTPEGIQVDAVTGGGPALFPSAHLPASPGEFLSASWDISVPAGYPAITVRAAVYDYSTGGGIISQSVVDIAPGSSAVVKAKPYGGRAVAGATGVRTILYLDDTGVAGVRFIAKNNLLSEVPGVGDEVGPYFDGGSFGTSIKRSSWLGPVNNSASIVEERVFVYPPVPKGSLSLRSEDVLVEYRDKDLKRQGSIPMSDLSLKMQPVFNGVGSWQVKLPAEHRAVPYLRTPGSGIVVTNLRTGETLLSGPTSRPSKKATSSDPQGLVTISGLTDDRFLWDARAFPSPQFADPSDAVVANDVRTLQASTLLMAYVSANIGPGSPAGRRGSSLRNKITMGPNPNLGIITTRRPRYDVIGELLYGIAIEAGLGFRLVQVGESLEFQVYKPTDRSATIRLDVHNGTLDSQTVEVAPPEVTRMIVAGQGVGEERQMVSVTTPESLEAEELWGLIIEEFKDQRQTDQEEELDSAGLERLMEAGFTKVAVKAVPSNDQTMIFMTDFFLGDEVAIVIDGQEEPNSIITEAVILVDEDGVRTGVAIGDIADFDSASALRSTVDDTVRRVEHLERNVEIPPQFTSSGKQVADWDDAADAGFYWAEASALNSPAAALSVGITELDGTGNVIQTVHRSASAASSGIGPGWRRRRSTLGIWSAWQANDSSDGLPESQYANGPSANLMPWSAGSWGNMGSLGVEVKMTPPRDLWVDAQVNAICKASTGYTMIGLNVAGGVVVPVDQDPDGTERGSFWTPFTSSSVDTAIMTPPKRILVPAGVETSFQLYARRNVSSGTHTTNYPFITVNPVRWA